LKRLLRFFLVTTIVAAIQVHLAAAATVSEDVPVRGGRAALAATFGIQPIPDRARFVSEFARLLHGLSDRKPTLPEILSQQLRQSAASAAGANELVPVPLTAAVWSKAVFLRPVTPGDLLIEIFSNRQASMLCYGLSALDDETLQYLADHPGVLTQIYVVAAEAFAVFAESVRIKDGRIVPPGGDEAIPLWEEFVGASVTRPDRFLVALFTQAEGRMAKLFDTIGQLDRGRQRFALGLWMQDSRARLGGMRAFAAASIAPSGDWRTMKAQPFVRQPYDLTALLMRVRVDAAGAPMAPSSLNFWARVFEAGELPLDSARILKESADGDRPIDAARLAGLTVFSGDIRLRAERLDQFAFGQRVFAGASPAEMADVFVAVRAFRRYRMLMITLERIGIRNPATYAAAARLASRMSPPDPARAFVATAQFQGALALLERMRTVGTLDPGKAETLVNSLLAVPLSSSSQYLGGVLRWIAENLRASLPPGDSLDAVVQAALAGPDTTLTAPKLEWEGRRYRVDVAAAERQRLARVREKQGGATLDLALDLASAARRLAPSAPGPLTLGIVQGVTTQLKAAEERSARSDQGRLQADGFPPGVVPPPDPRERAIKAIDELAKVTDASTLTRTPRAVVELVDAADEAAAQALVSLAYAVDLGDPDGAVLLPGDVSRRHDFGFGQRDNDQRLRAAWMMPRPDVSPGVPWHVDGSLVGLDIALAPIAMRRISSDRALGAPTLSSNDRETFAFSFGLMNPFALTDTTRDAIAEAIENGRRRVSLMKDVSDVESVAGELDMDGWRRRAIRWTILHEPDRLESMFSLGELLALGDPAHEIDLDPWGTSSIVATGCVCTRMPPPGRLPLFVGRRQVGLLATVVPDLNLHVARMLSLLRLPARLAKYVLSAAVQDFVDEVRATDPDDWLSLVRWAAAVPRDRIEDYVAAAAADGPLVPDSSR
jgi:hypothetical protein